jgi:hypothetical protein
MGDLRYEIWADNPMEAEWFGALDDRLQAAKVEAIGPRGQNPKLVEDLVAYDRPDILLFEDGRPLLVLEKTREVPTGHNVGQRFARLVRAAEFGVPFIFFLPFDKRKQGIHSSVCNLNSRLLRAMEKVSQVHETPSLAINWPMNDVGELVGNGTEDEGVRRVVADLLSGYDAPGSYLHVKETQQTMKKEAAERERLYPSYKGAPPSVSFLNTKQFFSQYEVGADETRRLQNRDVSLVYRMDMSPEKCKRQDPYTGMQFIYDYMFLRTGPSPADREMNLVLHVPKVSMDTWLSNNPEDYDSKSCNWYLTADAIALEDGYLELKDWPLARRN